jgi:hypothetical protein
VRPRRLHTCLLGALQGVGLGFTDAAPLPRRAGGGFLFTAVAEASADHISDGTCAGSAIGHMQMDGHLRWLRPLAGADFGAPKVEGLAMRAGREGIELCLVTDADHPLLPSMLLLARI